VRLKGCVLVELRHKQLVFQHVRPAATRSLEIGSWVGVHVCICRGGI
jgi:hypothetical protein